MLIEAEDNLEVLGEAGSGRQAAELARRTKPDVLPMNIRMPDGDGLAATREITGLPPPRWSTVPAPARSIEHPPDLLAGLIKREREITALAPLDCPTTTSRAGRCSVR